MVGLIIFDGDGVLIVGDEPAVGLADGVCERAVADGSAVDVEVLKLAGGACDGGQAGEAPDGEWLFVIWCVGVGWFGGIEFE